MVARVDPLVEVVAIGVAADAKLMIQPEEPALGGKLQPAGQVVKGEVAQLAAAAQRASDPRRALRREAGQRAVAILDAAFQRHRVGERRLEAALVLGRAQRHVAVARLPQKTVARQRPPVEDERIGGGRQRHHAAVEGRVEQRIFELVDKVQALARVEGDRRRNQHPVVADMVAKAAIVLAHADDAHRQPLIDGAADIERAPVMVEAAGLQLAAEMILEQRRLGDDVDRSARLPLARQGGGGALEHLEKLDRGDVARGVVAAVGREAVDQQVRPAVDVAGEAADRVIVP